MCHTESTGFHSLPVVYHIVCKAGPLLRQTDTSKTYKNLQYMGHYSSTSIPYLRLACLATSRFGRGGRESTSPDRLLALLLLPRLSQQFV
jgi:hypothetical protein